MAAQTGSSRYFPTIAADKTSGLVAALSICAALAGRARGDGNGAMVEVPMFESMVAFNLVEHLYGRHFDPPRAGTGYPRVLAPLRRPYQSADGHVCMMPYTDAHWRDFFRAAGRPELAADVRFTDISARTANIETLYEITGESCAGTVPRTGSRSAKHCRFPWRESTHSTTCPMIRTCARPAFSSVSKMPRWARCASRAHRCALTAHGHRLACRLGSASTPRSCWRRPD